MSYAVLHILSGAVCVAVMLTALSRRGGVKGLRLPLVVLTGGAALATVCLLSGGFAPTVHDALWTVAGIRIGFASVGAGAVGIGFVLWTRSQRPPVERVTLALVAVLDVAAIAVTLAVPEEQIVRSTMSWYVDWTPLRWFDTAVVGLGTVAVTVGAARRAVVGTRRGRAIGRWVLVLQVFASSVYFALRWSAEPRTLQLVSPLVIAAIALAYWTLLNRWRFAGVSDDALALLFSATPSPSVVIDLQSERVRLNPRAAQLFPGSPGPDELVRRLGLGWSAEVVLSSLRQELLPSVRIEGVADRVFDIHCHFDARRAIGLLVLNDVSERARHADELANTLSELRRAQDTLLMQEKIAALGVLVAGVNHEINNPLAYVTSNVKSVERHVRCAIGVLEVAGAAIEGSPGARETLAALQRSAEARELREDALPAIADALEGCQRISETVTSMRMLSRREDQAELLDLSEVARAGLKIGRTTLSPSVEVKADLDSPLWIQGGAGELSRVVTNLVVNAGQAMGAQGCLTVRSFERGGHAIVEVSDTGPGVPPGLRSRIFEPFFTTKPPGQGTGLGLAISYETLRHHRGELALVESANGACFQLSVPLIALGANAEPAQNEVTAPLLTRRVATRAAASR